MKRPVRSYDKQKIIVLGGGIQQARCIERCQKLGYYVVCFDKEEACIGARIADAFFAVSPSFAQGASQSIESAYELFNSIEKNTASNFFKKRVNKIKMVNIRSKFNQFAFHLSNPITTFLRNILLKRLVKNKKFLEGYLGKIYKT